MKIAKTLFFFTLQYPYGRKSETFIENEIQYLADVFERVIIFPRERDGLEQRQLPINVEVNDLLIDSKPVINHYKYILSSFNRLLEVAKVYGYTILKDKDRKHYFTNGYFIYYLANALKDAKLIETYLEKSKLQHAVFYDYWFVNSTLSLAILKSKNKINNLCCRAHGFDVFNERWDCGTVPFRAYICKHINALFAISNYNKNYILGRLKHYKDKVKVAYLGVRLPDIDVIPENEIKKEKPFLIVSCANLFPFKQIQRIPEVLKLLDLGTKSIKWVHFGDGPDEAELLQAANQLPTLITFEYKGHVKNQEVLNFYAKSNVDLFLSLSITEGLPVSMMEAQSFGIPIVAYGIFGIPEIVNETTGILLDTKATNDDIANKIGNVIKKEMQFNSDHIKEYFNDHFSAEKNFKDFTYNLQEE
jgi:glycosyltransferase involved in cell wall biosynthesis